MRHYTKLWAGLAALALLAGSVRAQSPFASAGRTSSYSPVTTKSLPPPPPVPPTSGPGTFEDAQPMPSAGPLKSEENYLPPQEIPYEEGTPFEVSHPHGGACCEEVEAEKEGCGLFVFGEYLRIRPRRRAHDFAISSPNTILAPGGTIESLSWDTVNGYRVGGGWDLPDSPWQIAGTYTYFHSNANRTVVPQPGGLVFATLPRSGSIDDVTNARASSNINYNTVDLEMIRIFNFGESTDVRVFGGGRFARIDQKFFGVYNGGSFGANNTIVSAPIDFRGAGLTFGSELIWKLPRNLGFYARGRSSLVSGEFRQSLTESDSSRSAPLVAVRENDFRVVPVIEAGVGLMWHTEHVFIRAGYELGNWFNFIDSPDFPGAANIGKVGRRSSDLSWEALAVQVGLIF
jgi:hypothetical protein